jgi:hypothetical protein
MRKLETIQTKENLNDVFAADEIGPGGANHEYHITLNNGKDTASDVAIIQMQKGPRKNVDSIHGVIDSDLLEIVRDRLKAFQAGPFASEYNEQALKHIEQALTWMNKRVEDRIKRNVLGTYNK